MILRMPIDLIIYICICDVEWAFIAVENILGWNVLFFPPVKSGYL